MQFQEAAQQRDADDIADVLDVQAADAEDAQVDEELAQSELGDALGIDSTNSDSLSKDSAKQAATTGLQAASDAASQAGGKAAGKTKDAHEADLDLTHMDKPAGRDDAKDLDMRHQGNPVRLLFTYLCVRLVTSLGMACKVLRLSLSAACCIAMSHCLAVLCHAVLCCAMC